MPGGCYFYKNSTSWRGVIRHESTLHNVRKNIDTKELAWIKFVICLSFVFYTAIIRIVFDFCFSLQCGAFSFCYDNWPDRSNAPPMEWPKLGVWAILNWFALVTNEVPYLSYAAVIFCVLFCMCAATLFNISAQTYMQQQTPGTMLGKVSSFVTVISVCALPVAAILFAELMSILITLALRKTLKNGVLEQTAVMPKHRSGLF